MIYTNFKKNQLFFINIEKYKYDFKGQLYRFSCFYYNKNNERVILFSVPTYYYLKCKLKYYNIPFNRVIFNLPYLSQLDSIIQDYILYDI